MKFNEENTELQMLLAFDLNYQTKILSARLGIAKMSALKLNCYWPDGRALIEQRSLGTRGLLSLVSPNLLQIPRLEHKLF